MEPDLPEMQLVFWYTFWYWLVSCGGGIVFVKLFFFCFALFGIEFRVVHFSITEHEKMRYPFAFGLVFQVQNSILLRAQNVRIAYCIDK